MVWHLNHASVRMDHGDRSSSGGAFGTRCDPPSRVFRPDPRRRFELPSPLDKIAAAVDNERASGAIIGRRVDTTADGTSTREALPSMPVPAPQIVEESPIFLPAAPVALTRWLSFETSNVVRYHAVGQSREDRAQSVSQGNGTQTCANFQLSFFDLAPVLLYLYSIEWQMKAC